MKDQDEGLDPSLPAMRKGFEEWARGEGLPLSRVVSDERYESMETEYSWRAFQAGWRAGRA